ncbi:MAG: winged helix-turn-helix domain-containing protein [Elusimicrobiota bacterium]
MIEALLGNKTAEKVLLFITVYGEGYAKKMATVFNLSVNGIQQQLQRLEAGGILVSQLKGRTRVYYFNPRCVFIDNIKALMEKVLSYMPNEEIQKYYRERTRPRRKGKI